MDTLTAPDVPFVSGDFLAAKKMCVVSVLCEKKKTPVRVLEVSTVDDTGVSVRKAIKTIPLLDSEGKDKWEHILKEISIMHSIQHLHVMRLDWAVRCEDLVAICMPLCSHGTLSTCRGRLSHEQIERYFLQTACALRYLHDLRIIHGDVKPANVLVHSSDNAVLADFGSARLLSDEEDTVGADTWEGTHGFVGPEVHSGATTVDAFLMDAYSLGATLWATVLRRKPRDKNLLRAVKKRVSLPDMYRCVLEKLVQKKPRKRQTVHSVLEALRSQDRFRAVIDRL